MSTSLASASLLLAVAVGIVSGHSSLVIPFSRNAVDKVLPYWQNGTFGPAIPGDDHFGCNCINASSGVCNVAQSCFWFSQGCTIGCETCDGGPSNPNTRDRCGSGMNATNNNPLTRTFNRDAVAGSPEDIYKHNPWRAPGAAPVYDPCGMAGGGPKEMPGEAKYTTTKFAQQGDLGSVVLPEAPTGVVWRLGETVEAAWVIRANHGGGYQYRLCPRSENLTEACFMQNPIPFAGKTLLRWSPADEMEITTTYLSVGTLPLGSTWAMNPLPYSNSQEAPQFAPPCNETVDRHKNDTGRCSGRDPFDVMIVDHLVIPKTLAPGRYVLGLRWDCEKSAQIWSSCADIEIAA